MFKYLIFILYIKIFFSASCVQGTNFCSRCNPVTKLCEKCDKEIYIPNENGGCSPERKCTLGNNHCSECQEDSILCKTCEDRYFPDEIGGCSYASDCEISYKGQCLKCQDDFALVGQDIKICKSIYSEDLKNCENINSSNGLCNKCKEGFYLNSGDKKCTNTQNCHFSSFGVCNKCSPNYYLDKREDNCKEQNGNLLHCAQTVDGQNCDLCDDDYYFDEEGKCTYIKYCAKEGPYLKCQKCFDNYYPTVSGESCTKEKECYKGNKDLGICLQCKSEYYIDFQDGHCKSNKEENDFKYCRKADIECYECSYGTYLGNDKHCSLSRNCDSSYNGVCTQCIDGYHLGKDNICSEIENCISTDFYGVCTECEDHFYYNKSSKLCEEEKENFENCRYTTFNGNLCDKCKKDFYYNKTDHLCYSNKEEGDFYKCEIKSELGEYCSSCIEGYYIGYIDNKCSLIEGCDLSLNEKECLQCDSDVWCLDSKTKKCEYNYAIQDENKKFYFKCNITNEEGTACKECIEGYILRNGLCVDESHCEEKNEDGSCKKCITYDEDPYYHCLNKDFGCVETYLDFCENCDNLLDFDICSKCFEGYIQNEKGECVEIK